MNINTHGKARRSVAWQLTALLGSAAISAAAFAAEVCPELYYKGKMTLPFMPAFVSVDNYRDGEGLTVSSFLNATRYKPPVGATVYTRFERDLVAKIPNIGEQDLSTFNGADVLKFTDFLDPLSPVTVWPNHAQKVPEDVLSAPWNDSEWVILPQGFLGDLRPGRLSMIRMIPGSYQEFLIHQSTQDGDNYAENEPGNQPRNYHEVAWHDMDGDGLKDAVTVRSSYKPPYYLAAYGELVYFKNPGADLDPNVPWQEVVLYGGLNTDGKAGDTDVDIADLDADGQVEIIATRFFTGPSAKNGQIDIYGAPEGGSWADVNADLGVFPRLKALLTNQGLPFGVTVVDLNGDGKLDLLATNHQEDGCRPGNTPGRVFGIETPEDGDLFNGTWVTHILKDGIRPQPTLAGFPSPGRLAPGLATPFWPVKFLEGISKPNIVVGGDEAGKVWVLTPRNPEDTTDWNYDSGVIFDINTYYGANTTQTPFPAGHIAQGRTNGTMGTVAVRYSDNSDFGEAEIYVPAYEAFDIHVLSYRKPQPDSELYACSPDVKYACVK